MNLTSLYARFFSKGVLSKINNRILNLSLRARGYNNFINFFESGENFFIKKVLAASTPKLCIDIGANVGNYTLELLTYTSAKVIAFEPLPIIFEKLKSETKRFSDRVVLENKGVGKSIENLTIHYNPEVLSHASFSEDSKKVSYTSNEQQAIVPVVTLDSYCKSNNLTEIDLIKIDTEGFEEEVFEGAISCFSIVKPKFIQFEFNWHQLFRNHSLNFFVEKLPEYDVFQLIPGGWIKRDPKDPLTNIYYFSNFVFVRRS